MRCGDGFIDAGVIVGKSITFSNALAGRGSERVMETKNERIR